MKILGLNISGLVLGLVVFIGSSQAAYVTPKRGGGQVDNTVAPMIHAFIDFAYNQLSVELESGKNTPILTPLPSGSSFDPNTVYYTSLNEKAYNWQYAWVSEAPLTLPANTAVWIEQTAKSSPYLNVYDRNNNYTPIFGTKGSSTIWKWSGGMVHNAYTVTPSLSTYWATYRLYIGDANTGTELPEYGDATLTLNWQSVPEPATLGFLGLGALSYARKRLFSRNSRFSKE